MQRPQKLSLTLRLKSDVGVFPAIEAAAVLSQFVAHLRKSAYSTPLDSEGAFLHMSGGIEWSLNDGECSSSPEAGLDEGVRSKGRSPDATESERNHERSKADGSSEGNGEEGG